MVRYVIAGVDGSTESLAAAHWAARESLRRGMELRLVHAWEWHPRPPASVPLGTGQRAWAEQTLDEVVRSVRAAHPGLGIEDRLVREAPVAALLDATDEAELLVLGSRGLSGLAGFVVGSVSQRVVARSTRPVVLVRSGESAAGEHLPAPDGVSPDEIPELPYRDVVLGLDVSHPCDELIEFAFAAARRRGTGLRVVHAYRVPTAYAVDYTYDPVPGTELLAERERAVVAALRPWCAKFPEVTVVETVVEGRAAGALVDASADASLVVVGRRIRDARPGPHTGPVTHAVLHHVGCPVAVVPHT
ncbi:universal stress protein [Streptomyces neyagawaensis]|uniref:universal stress protein n=1 Tax=Streptomyces neyagawaensis TaxID=42238 RepID=UPI0006E1E708|nr:universal stress protein [Streptomyces neyagawaensis]MCL6735989.1 universal stress protein [Streptomyces neyagawaensis]MDE1686907.1 universal stress protein [Streptomyces neyagawaensis]